MLAEGLMDWIGMALTIVTLWLIRQRSILCWPSGIASNLCWIASMVPLQQWSVVSINLVMLAMNISGWIKWSQDDES